MSYLTVGPELLGQSCAENTEIMSQNKASCFKASISWVFCYSNRKLADTGIFLHTDKTDTFGKSFTHTCCESSWYYTWVVLWVAAKQDVELREFCSHQPDSPNSSSWIAKRTRLETYKAVNYPAKKAKWPLKLKCSLRQGSLQLWLARHA